MVWPLSAIHTIGQSVAEKKNGEWNHQFFFQFDLISIALS
jgi:hypothetical protein